MTASSCAGASGSASGAGRRDERLPDGAEPRAEEPAAVAVELGEGVVEQQERRHTDLLGQQLRLGEEEREHREPLLAL